MSKIFDVWAVAKTIYENTSASYRDLRQSLEMIFGDDAPSLSTIHTRSKAEKWNKKNPTPATIDGETGNILNDTHQKIQEKMDSIVASAEVKKQKIVTHRKRLKVMGELQDTAMDNIKEMLDMDIAENSDDVRAALIINKGVTDMLSSLAGVQKMIAEQEFALYQITPDDFGQSEAERRAESLALLDGIHEQEKQVRENRKAELMARLREFENLSLDDMVIDDE